MQQINTSWMIPNTPCEVRIDQNNIQKATIISITHDEQVVIEFQDPQLSDRYPSIYHALQIFKFSLSDESEQGIMEQKEQVEEAQQLNGKQDENDDSMQLIQQTQGVNKSQVKRQVVGFADYFDAKEGSELFIQNPLLSPNVQSDFQAFSRNNQFMEESKESHLDHQSLNSQQQFSAQKKQDRRISGSSRISLSDQNKLKTKRTVTEYQSKQNDLEFIKPLSRQISFSDNSSRDPESFNELSSDNEPDLDNRQKTRNLTIAYNIAPNLSFDNSELNQFLVSPNAYVSQSPQNSEISMSKDFQTSLDKLDKGFVKTINETGFMDVCEQQLKKFKTLFSELNVEKYLAYTKVPLSRKRSFSQIPQQLVGQFQECHQYLYTRTAPQQATKWITQLLSIVHQNNQPFTDEIYLHTLKQLRLCPNPELQVYYSQIILNLSSSYSPSQHWFFAMMNYLYVGARAYEPLENLQAGVRIKLQIKILKREVAENLRMSFFRLMKTFGNPRRRYSPTLEEVTFTTNHQQFPIAVAIYMQNFKFIDIEPHYQTKQTVQLICKQLKISHLAERLNLCLCMPEGHENIIDNQNLIIDILQDIEQKNAQQKVFI